MRIYDFISIYELHDSLLTEVVVNGDTLELTVDFCYWMQDGYWEDDPETGIIHLRFDDINEYSGPTGEIDGCSILKTEYDEDTFRLLLLDDFNDKSLILSFRSRSGSVEVKW